MSLADYLEIENYKREFTIREIAMIMIVFDGFRGAEESSIKALEMLVLSFHAYVRLAFRKWWKGFTERS